MAMRKLFALFIMCCTVSVAWAEKVIVFIPGEDMGYQQTVSTEDGISKDGVTIHTTYGAFAAPQYRFGKNSVTTVTSVVGAIIKIEFICTQNNPASGFSEPALELEENDGIWRGNSDVVTFVAGNKQVRATKIIVTVDAGGLSNPVIEPVAGTYYEPIEVSITCRTSDAQIYYTLDGSDPTTGSRQYTAPFSLNTNTTVKAISSLDGEVSEVVCNEYEFDTATPVQIKDLINYPVGSTVIFTSPLTVLAQKNNNLYVKDETGCTLIFGDCGHTYSAGDVIPAGCGGIVSFYNGEVELKNPFGFKDASGSVILNPDTITASQVGHDLWAHLVYLEDVTFDLDAKTVTDAFGNTVPVYFSMGMSASEVMENTHYSLTAIVGSYGRDSVIYQLLPIKAAYHGTPPTMCDLYTMEDGVIYTSMVETVVLHQYNKYLYVKQDGCYGLIYGAVGQTYKLGDIIPEGWSGVKNTYSGYPELAPPLTGFQPATESKTVIPEEITASGVNPSNWAHYVMIPSAVISEVSGNTFKITDSQGNSCTGCVQGFNGLIPEGFVDTLSGVVVASMDMCMLLVTNLEIPILPVNCLDEVYACPPGTKVKLQLKAIYQNGKYLHVQDSCGNYGLIYGDVNISTVNGDIIEGIITWSQYHGSNQLSPCGDFEIIGHGEPVEPILVPIEEISFDMDHWYVAIDNVELDLNTWVITDETAEIQMYNRYNIEITNEGPGLVINPCDLNNDGELSIADLNKLINIILSGEYEYYLPEWYNPYWTNDNLYYVEGFVAIYNEKLQLVPTKIVKHGLLQPILWGDVNRDLEITVADVNCLVEIILSN